MKFFIFRYVFRFRRQAIQRLFMVQAESALDALVQWDAAKKKHIPDIRVECVRCFSAEQLEQIGLILSPFITEKPKRVVDHATVDSIKVGNNTFGKPSWTRGDDPKEPALRPAAYKTVKYCTVSAMENVFDFPAARKKLKEWLAANPVPEPTLRKTVETPHNGGVKKYWTRSPEAEQAVREILGLGGHGHDPLTEPTEVLDTWEGTGGDTLFNDPHMYIEKKVVEQGIPEPEHAQKLYDALAPIHDAALQRAVMLMTPVEMGGLGWKRSDVSKQYPQYKPEYLSACLKRVKQRYQKDAKTLEKRTFPNKSFVSVKSDMCVLLHREGYSPELEEETESVA